MNNKEELTAPIGAATLLLLFFHISYVYYYYAIGLMDFLWCYQ